MRPETREEGVGFSFPAEAGEGPGGVPRHLVRNMLRWGAAVFAVAMLIQPFLAPDPLPLIVFYVTVLATILVLLRFVGRARIRTLGIASTFLFGAITVAMVLASGGLESPTMVAFPVLVLAAAVFWSGRAGLVMAVVSTGFFVLLAVVESRGYLPEPLFEPFLARRAVAFAAATLVTGIVMHTALRGLGESLERVRRSQRQFAALLEGLSTGVLVADRDGRILHVNRAMTRLLGREREELRGRRTLDLFPRWEWHRLREVWRATGEGSPGQGVETRLVRPDGPDLPVLATPVRIRWEEGEFMVLAVQDLSELKRLEAERHEMEHRMLGAQKMESLGQLAGGVAHDFNNLLTVILGNTSEGLADGSLPPENRARLEEIRDAAERAAELTRQLLAFARKQPAELRPVDLSALVKESADLLRRTLGERIRVEVTECPGAWVEADANQMEQVLLNLATNARDAMPRGGTLRISVRCVELDEQAATAVGLRPGPHVELSVRDTGEGMTEELKDRIFEPFFTTKEVGKGTGLGLAMVDGIVRQNAGAVSVETAPGEGTEFRILLPRIPPPG